MSVYRQATLFDHLPKGTRFLIIANALIFFTQFLFPAGLLDMLALTPILVLKKYYVWQFITYSFLHAGFWHLFWNLFSLWMFGSHIENYWGTPTFLRYYFLCVLGAGLMQSVLAPTSTVMGASGGVYGLLLAFGLLFPDVTLHLFFFFPLRAIQAVGVIALMTLLFSMNTGGSRVAHLAHLGGMLTGLLYFKLPQWSFHMKRPSFGVIFPEKKDANTRLTDDVNRILDKISSQGVSSLTDKEKEIMKKYGEQQH